MQRKPIILIMTSRDEPDNISKKIAAAIMATGTHNAVVMSDDKYGSASKLSALDRLMDTGSEYQYLLERKDTAVIKERLKARKYSQRVTRIRNMLRRFRPEYILCVTPYAHHCAVEAKRRLKSDVGIIYMLMSFAVGRRNFDDETDVYIVENQEVKSSLVRMGVRSKNIMTMGLPFDIKKPNEEEIADLKQDLGLPRTDTVFVSFSDKNSLQTVFSLLLNQGDVANLVVHVENPKVAQTLGSMSLAVPDVNVTFIKSRDKIDEILPLCDLAITDYDISTIYKCMKLGIPPIIYTKDIHTSVDLTFLVNQGLCVRAKEDIDVIGLEYKLLQTDLAKSISENGVKWTEINSLENIANFLVSYIAV